jgi:hypothetical protein
MGILRLKNGHVFEANSLIEKVLPWSDPGRPGRPRSRQSTETRQDISLMAFSAEISPCILKFYAKNYIIYKMRNPKLLKQIEYIERLEDEDQRVLTILLDDYIKKHKFELLAQN